MNARLYTALCAIGALMLGPRPSIAQQLIIAVVPMEIAVASNYSGSDVVVFGAIDLRNLEPRPFDVVVTVFGPHQNVVVRRKQKVAGVWVNHDARTFIDVPTYLGVFTNRPIEKIADEGTRRKFEIGLRNVLAPIQGSPSKDAFLANLIQIRTEEGFYTEQSNAVTFLSPNTFRTQIELPSDAATGTYQIVAKLFADGALVSHASGKVELAKVGIEELVTLAAIDHSFLYGLTVMIMALTTGWLASISLRRE